MRLPDDDELYDIDQTYLGPPGRYIGVMRHKTIFAALVLLPILFVAARKVGIPMTLMSCGLLLIVGVGSAMFIADHTSAERGVAALFSSAWHDLSARRPVSLTHRASGAGYLRAVSSKGLPGLRPRERTTTTAGNGEKE